MIVEKLNLIKDKKYLVIIDGNSYEFDEEVIVKYRLVKGKEITKEDLDNAINKNNIMSFYYKALNYALTYGKSQKAIYNYLKEKQLLEEDIIDIIDSLKKIKIIDDQKYIESLMETFYRKSYGKLMIEKKLYEKMFYKEDIDYALNHLDYDAYYNGLKKLYEKIKDKYKDDNYIKNMKIKKYLLSRGYTYEDIGNLNL